MGLWQVSEETISKLEDKSIETLQSNKQKKERTSEKYGMTLSDQRTWNMSIRRRGERKRRRKKFEVIVAENFPNLMTNINIHIKVQ